MIGNLRGVLSKTHLFERSEQHRNIDNNITVWRFNYRPILAQHSKIFSVFLSDAWPQ
jgi:hypothetical protein